MENGNGELYKPEYQDYTSGYWSERVLVVTEDYEIKRLCIYAKKLARKTDFVRYFKWQKRFSWL